MANLVITSTTNAIKVVFNDQPFKYEVDGDSFSKGTWQKDEISSIVLNSTHVHVSTKDEINWALADTTTDGAFVVDTVDGASPSSLSDLYDKLIALIA